MKQMIAGLLVLSLMPCAALAVQNGVVEEAAQIELNEGIRRENYLPDESVYAGSEGMVPPWGQSETYVKQEADLNGFFWPPAQLPELMPGEIVRAQKLLAAYGKGERTGNGQAVLNRTEEVVVGVYPLDPGEFDGESVYLILPGTCLTDEQLLDIIDAYHMIGLSFEPEKLSFRNCARGGGTAASRFPTEDERKRYQNLNDQVHRGILSQSKETNLPVQIKLDARYFSGMEQFTLRPYRRLEDEELITMLMQDGAESQSNDLIHTEKQTRQALISRFSLPLSMKMEGGNGDSMYQPIAFDVHGTKGTLKDVQRQALYGYFSFTTDRGFPANAQILLDQQTGKIVSARWNDDCGEGRWDEAKPPLDERVYLEAAAAYAESVTGEKLDFKVVKSLWLQDSPVVEMKAKLPADEWLTIWTDFESAAVRGAVIETDTVKAFGLSGEIQWKDNIP